MVALGSGCKYRLSLAERFDCTETIINQLLADSYQNPISEWQVKTSSGLPLILHYGELYYCFIIYYDVIIIEITCTINVMRLNHPETIPLAPARSVEKRSSKKPNRSLVTERLGTAAVWHILLSYLFLVCSLIYYLISLSGLDSGLEKIS